MANQMRCGPVRLVFSKTRLEALQPPATGRVYVYDQKCPGLALCLTAAGSRVFYFYAWGQGKPQRIRLGAVREITIDQARRLAAKHRVAIGDGRDPQTERRLVRQEPTLADLHRHWMEVYAKPHKRSWKEDQRRYDNHLLPWAAHRLSTIKKADVQALIAGVAQKRKPPEGEKGRERGGRYEANRLLALLRAMLNRADEVGYEGVNPAARVKPFREESRDRFLQPDELPRFFTALGEEQPTIRDLFWLCLLTGARLGNVVSMAWADVSFDLHLWRIPETKGGHVVVVPLVDQALNVLRVRLEAANGSPWVFPAPSRSGHVVNVRKPWGRLCQRAGLGDLRIHDLRRTMGSWQASTGASLLMIGKMLGHTTASATQVYARLALEPVRAAAERAVGAMEAAGGLLPAPQKAGEPCDP